MSQNEQKKKRGPDPERVKIDKPWDEAVGDALKKKRPKKGWPDSHKSKKNIKKPD